MEPICVVPSAFTRLLIGLDPVSPNRLFWASLTPFLKTLVVGSIGGYVSSNLMIFLLSFRTYEIASVLPLIIVLVT